MFTCFVKIGMRLNGLTAIKMSPTFVCKRIQHVLILPNKCHTDPFMYERLVSRSMRNHVTRK